MPTYGTDNTLRGMERRQLARAQVRAKFPELLEGSSGWHRAMDNRLRKLRGL